LTQQPLPIKNLNREVPIAIEKIILKMLAKKRDDRYKSCLSLQRDIEYCIECVDGLKRPIPDDFVPGTLLANEVFTMPNKIFGRAQEIYEFEQILARVQKNKTPEMIAISGPNGAGKTLLCTELLRRVMNRSSPKLLVCMGSYSGENNKASPFSGIMGAISQLVMKLMEEGSQAVAEHKAKILKALNGRGYLLTQQVPELEYIIGEQLPLSTLYAEEAYQRLESVVSDFISLFTTEERSLCLVLDNIHLADASSLRLLGQLCTTQKRSLLVVGSYRNDVSFDWPSSNPLRTTITLQPLAVSHVNKLVGETLGMSESETQDVSRFIFSASKGNPFYVKDVFFILYLDGVISFDHQRRCWKWDTTALQNTNLDLTQRLDTQHKDLQTVLRIAACVGLQVISANVLAQVLATSREEKTNEDTIHALLRPAIHEGWLLEKKGFYQFTHTIIRETIYNLVSEDERKQHHVAIGKALLEEGKKTGMSNELLFNVANHLNFGIDSVRAVDADRRELHQLNLRVGKLALSLSAIDTACHYADIAKVLLPVNPWALMVYETSLKSMLLCAQCETARKQYESAIQIYEHLLTKVKGEADTFQVQNHLLQTSAMLGRYEFIYDEYLTFLAKNSSTLCLVANDDRFIQDWIVDHLDEIKQNLSRLRRLEDIMSLPQNSNRERTLFMKCLINCTCGVYMGKNANKVYMLVTPLLLAKMMFDEGACDDVTHCILSLLGWLISYLDDPQLGSRLGHMGVELGKRLHGYESGFALTSFFGFCQFICQSPFQQIYTMIDESNSISTRVEEQSYGTHTATLLSLLNIVGQGDSIATSREKMARTRTFLQQHNNVEFCDHLLANEELLNILTGETDKFDPQYVTGESIEDLPYSRFIVRFSKVLACYFAGDYKTAYRTLKHATSLVEDVYGSPMFFMFRWFSTIIASTFYEHFDEINKREQSDEKKKQFSIMEHVLGKDAKSRPKTEKERVFDEVIKHFNECKDLHTRAPEFMEAAYQVAQAEQLRAQGSEHEAALELYRKAEAIANNQGLKFLRAMIVSRIVSLAEHMKIDTTADVQIAFAQWSEMGAKRICASLIDRYSHILTTVSSITTDVQTPSIQQHPQDDTKPISSTIDRFAPTAQILKHLGKEKASELRAGDAVARHMAVISVDIRSFASLTNNKSAVETMFLLNSFVGSVIPTIEKHHGFVEKSITDGDTITAMFPDGVGDAIKAAVVVSQLKNIKVGIGIHAGP
jgi:predicted ATPase